MATPEEIRRARRLRKRHKHERQALIFGVLIAALAVTGVTGWAIYSGAIEPPFDRPFSVAEETAKDPAPPVPCLAAGTMSVPYSDITVNVFNGTKRPGLAGTVTAELRQRGFVVQTTGDATQALSGVQVAFGKEGLAAAYTVAAQFPSATLFYDDRPDAVVDVTLGQSYVALLATEAVPLSADQPMASNANCYAIDTLTPAVRPVPADTTTETPTDATEDDVPEGGGEGVPVE